MKKLYLMAVLFSAMLFLTPVPVAAADSVDQSCDALGSGMIGPLLTTDAYQMFKPTQNRLSRIDLDLSIVGLQPSQNITLKVYKGGSLLTSSTRNVPNTSFIKVAFDFTDITVNPGEDYKIVATSDSSPLAGYWLGKGVDCYSRGLAYYNNSPQDYDYGFTTYGWNYTAPATPAPAATGTTGTTAKTTTGTTPATTTTANGQTPATETTATTPTEETATATTTEAPKKLTLVQSITSKPIYWLIPSVVILAGLIGFLVFYELKMKPNVKKEEAK
jgi:hypothetical protein